jgi:hypothetical protein
MKLDRSFKIAIWLALLTSFPLVLWSFWLSARIKGRPVSFFLDSFSFIPGLRTACLTLPVVAVGYMLFIVVRAICSRTTNPGHLVALCVSWILGTFALHCWVLSGLVGGMPFWPSAKRDSEEQSMALNSLLTGTQGVWKIAHRRGLLCRCKCLAAV